VVSGDAYTVVAHCVDMFPSERSEPPMTAERTSGTCCGKVSLLSAVPLAPPDSSPACITCDNRRGTVEEKATYATA